MPDDDKNDSNKVGNLMNVVDSIPKFTGDDMTYSSARWTQDLEDNAEIFGWTPQQKLIIARRCLGGTAELWLRTEKAFKNYEELKTALLKEFPEAVNSKQMHEMMSTRKKRSNESYYQYMLVMKELGKRAKFPDYVSIQYIIDGIIDYESNKLLFYGVTSYPVLKEKLALYESFKRKTLKKPLREKSEKEESDKKPKEGGQVKQFLRCYKCGEKGHTSTSCLKGVKCFKCNEYGHIATNCKTENPTEKSSNNGGARSIRKSMFVTSQEVGNSDLVNEESDGEPEASARVSDQITKSSSFGHVHFPSSSNQCDIDIRDRCQRGRVLNINKAKRILNKSVKLVKIGNIMVHCLIDTGSDLNLVTFELYKKLGSTYKPEKMLLTGLGTCKVFSIGTFEIDVVIDHHSYHIGFHIVPDHAIPYDIILGQPFLVNTITVINKGSVEIRPQCYDSSYLHNICLFSSLSDERPSVQEIIHNYTPKKIRDAPIKLKIVLKDDVPVTQRPRRLALAEENIVKQQVEEWLSKNIIRPSFSEYASPLVLVKKKDGGTRVCVDYRKINEKMVKDEYPLPVIDDHIDKLSNVNIFSTLDLKNGFFHLPIEEDSVKYTAFVTSNPEGQYEFLRAPFGLSVCPKYFTRYINIIFSDFIRQGIVLIFIDDLIILSNNEEEGISRLKEVLKVASEYGLEINWKKTQLLQTSVQYLGHNISNGTVKPSSEKIKAVKTYPLPRNLKDVQSYIGLTSYFRKFINNYAMIAKPLTDLLKKKGEFQFGEEQIQAFEELKSRLCCEPVLRIFDIHLETELHTDASKYGYAAILMQRDSYDGKLHPVHYMSRKTTEPQQKCSSYELEALAVIEGVKKFRRYLIGIHFKIVTDCEAFQKTLNKKDVPAKVARWILYLQDFDFSIEHRAGQKMQHVDALSRNICLVNVELHARIKKAQDEDEKLKTIAAILKEKEYEDYYLESGVVYKGIEKKLVVPEIMDVEIIKRVHGMGHFGKKKVKDLIEKEYYISKLEYKIDKVISTCVPCILASRKSGKKEGWLNPIDKGDLPLDTLHCDHLGPLDATKKMYNYILTVIDGFTKFVWIYPVKTVTAKETIEKLKFHQKDYGNPRRIITDRGTAFTGNEFAEYCLLEQIEHIIITTGVPRGNGQVERMNRIIISTLTKMCIEEPGHWYKYVSKLQRVINGTYQRSINTTPFELLTGVKMKIKEDIKIIELLEEENRAEFMEKRDESRKEAKAQILRIQEENRKHYNKKRKEGEKYKQGDLVAIQRTQFGNALKLKPKYFGPYRVKRELGKDRYEVEKVDRGKEGPINTSTVVDFMKRWP